MIAALVPTKAAIWSATGADVNFALISNGVVKEINGFLFYKCKETAAGIELQ